MRSRNDLTEGRSPWALPGLLLGAIVLFLPGLGLHDWWYPDEPDVALPAIEMAARGDWVVPTHNGEPWLDYPPLAYWGMRLAGLVLGELSPLATRLPMLASFCVMLFATVQVGRRLVDESSALLAGAVLVGTPVLWLSATMVQVDLGFAAAQAVGFAAYLRGEGRIGTAAWVWRALGFAAFGVAILAKGPLGLLLPGLVLTAWHVWNREGLRVLQLAPLAVVSLLVALPWYLFLAQRLGSEQVLNELYLQNFDRFQGAARGHGGKGLHYYIKSLVVDFLPWSLLVVPALWDGFRRRREQREWRLLAVWLIAPLVFFTVASTKRNVYLLPIYPALALLVADWLGHAGAGARDRWRRWVALGWGGFLMVAGLGFLVAWSGWSLLLPHLDATNLTPDMLSDLRPGVLIFGAILSIVGGIALRLTTRQKPSVWPVLAGGGALLWSAATLLVLPVIDRQRSYEPAARWLTERVGPEEPIGFYWPGREATKRPAWLCHLDGRRLVFFGEAEAARDWLAAGDSRLLLTSPPLVRELGGVESLTTWRISSTDWAVVRGVEPGADGILP